MEAENSIIPESLSHDSAAYCVRGMESRRSWLRRSIWGAIGTSAGVGYYQWVPPTILPLYFNGRYAYAHDSHPAAVHRVVAVANELVEKPYKLGGGHKVLFDSAFDCSGSISYVLYRCQLLDRPLNSSEFIRYGLPGLGIYVTVYVKACHHVFMEVCGLRFDTSGSQSGEGPRWRVNGRSREGFYPRHPAWL